MQDIFSQDEPQPGSDAMKLVSSPMILVVATLVGTIIGTIISALFLGITHIIDFSWIMLFIGCILLVITGCFVWYSIRKGQRDRAALLADYQQFKKNWESFFSNEQSRLDKWAISYTANREKEYKERYEELKRQCMAAIRNAEQQLDITVKNAQSLDFIPVDGILRKYQTRERVNEWIEIRRGEPEGDEVSGSDQSDCGGIWPVGSRL